MSWKDKFTFKKILKSIYLLFLYVFAGYGFLTIGVYVAQKYKLTNEAGGVDANSRYFQMASEKYNQNFKVDSVSMVKHRYEVLNRIMVLNEYHPTNAMNILEAYKKNSDEKLALQMLDAVDLRLSKNNTYRLAKQKLLAKLNQNTKITALSVFDWMNIEEWKHFKLAVAKDKKYIDSAAQVSGVEARIIVSCLVGEQVRLFNSRRERFKSAIAPMRSLALETNQSYGVTGIKENTAKNIEYYLTKKDSPFYLGSKFEHVLDYDTLKTYTNKMNDTMSLRVQRLVQFQNHYFSYLYAGLFVKQIKMQWQRAGFPIDHRPEILASLFNLGYDKSKPKKNPDAGGSVFKVRETEYTFGSVAYEFYFSGELMDLFPYEKKHFDWLPEHFQKGY